MPLRVCTVCGKQDKLAGRIRSDKCRSCASHDNRPWRQTGTKYLRRINKITRNVEYLHRQLMEKHIGRKLEEGEVVHHIDGNKRNNNINNLELLTHSEHSTQHIIERNEKENLHVRAANIRWGNI